jgi:hypothetical protein
MLVHDSSDSVVGVRLSTPKKSVVRGRNQSVVVGGSSNYGGESAS